MNKSEKFWDRLSKKYDTPDKIKEVADYKSMGYIKQYLKPEDVVLDFGCATGAIAFYLADKVREMHGIDISSGMIEIAKQRAGELGIEDVSFTHASIHDERFKAESFNMVIAFSVLHLLDDLEKVMIRIHELLKPGGYFVAMTPCLAEKKFIPALVSMAQKIRLVPVVRCFEIPGLEKAVSGSGFKIRESISIDDNPLEHFIIAEKM